MLWSDRLAPWMATVERVMDDESGSHQSDTTTQHSTCQVRAVSEVANLQIESDISKSSALR
ncbi:hypothetical protein [Nitrincola sp. A-D6]|uniref:hypothetical protein n=1 Tax=Nitrincola sp. A-D6 TaxID=1545442 RepID=UPI0013643F45|nr:hypothetical protein [Nitrincola sp. A-D6]